MLSRLAAVLTLLLVLISSSAAFAQSVTTIEGIPLRTTITELLKPIAVAPVGDAIAFATAIEVNTSPLGTSSGGFVFKLDPTTGLQVRTASTFGPAFAERVLTTGAGKMSVGASLAVATYDKLGDFNLSQMQLSSITASTPEVSRTGNASLAMSSETLVITGAVGATDNLDLGVSVPMVKVKLDGLSWVKRGDNNVILRATGGGIASGLGDIAVVVKYRFLRFGQEQPDPGGLGFQLVSRLPTGSSENLRGLGINRVLGTLLFSSGQGKFRPHANGGFEWWEKGLVVQSGLLSDQTVTVRHQIQYAAGAEFEAAPKVTLLLDFLGRHVLGGGRIDMLTYHLSPDQAAIFGVNSFQAAGVTDHAIRKMILVPGFKWNVRGSFVLAFNARIPLFDNSLYDKFTPVVGLDFTF